MLDGYDGFRHFTSAKAAVVLATSEFENLTLFYHDNIFDDERSAGRDNSSSTKSKVLCSATPQGDTKVLQTGGGNVVQLDKVLESGSLSRCCQKCQIIEAKFQWPGGASDVPMASSGK